jgi:hypothetical protein
MKKLLLAIIMFVSLGIAQTPRIRLTGISKYPTPHKVYLMGDSLTGTSGNYGTTLQTLLGSNWQVIWKGIPGALGY